MARCWCWSGECQNARDATRRWKSSLAGLLVRRCGGSITTINICIVNIQRACLILHRSRARAFTYINSWSFLISSSSSSGSHSTLYVRIVTSPNRTQYVPWCGYYFLSFCPSVSLSLPLPCSPHFFLRIRSTESYQFSVVESARVCNDFPIAVCGAWTCVQTRTECRLVARKTAEFSCTWQ